MSGSAALAACLRWLRRAWRAVRDFEMPEGPAWPHEPPIYGMYRQQKKEREANESSKKP